MKNLSLVLFVLVTTAAFGQWAGSISSAPNPYRPPSNPAHASTHALAAEQSVLSGQSYSAAQGEKPMWEFPQAPAVPLGDIARTLKVEHAKLKKAHVRFEN
jgi:hypothetical protein